MRFPQRLPALVPSGMIMIWKSTIATIPSGWVFCDGSNGTPDMRDVFPVGARQDDAGVAKSKVTGSLTQTGGALGHIHPFSGSLHNHPFTGDGHAHYSESSIEVESPAAGGSYAWDDAYNATSTDSASGTTDSVAAGGSVDNQNQTPPRRAVVFAMKI